jgi:hypothetical protein
MSDTNESAPQTPDAVCASHAALGLRLERLRALRSAFGALAPSAVTEAGREIAVAGRDLTERLAEAARAPAPPSAIALTQIDTALDAFESTMRRLACGIAVAQLRSTLPGRMSNDRRSVLDLLDLMLGDGIEDARNLSDRIGTIDYLITLLCTHGARRHGIVAHDPVRLTSRITALCTRQAAPDDPRIPDLETEFFGAITQDGDRVHEDIQRRSFRQRKIELGPVFFEPRVLRAIVTYNAAQLERVTDAILEAGDWGMVEAGADETAGEASDASVFASRQFRRIAAAVRERIRGEVGSESPERRIALALELENLEDSEIEVLESEAVGTHADPIGTAILVGLMCRSLAVLSIDLQGLGLVADDVSDLWVDELDARFRKEIEEKLANDAYKQACALTELKNKFLFAPLADRLREEHVLTHSAVRKSKGAAGAVEATTTPAGASTAVARRSAEAPTAAGRSAKSSPGSERSTSGRPTPDRGVRAGEPDRRRTIARDLVREALDEDRRGRERSARARGTSRRLAGAWIARAALVAIAIAIGVQLYFARGGRDLEPLGREQLGSVSSYLVDGRRNGDGRGPGFVGTVDERWTSLPLDGRQAEAESIVERLREHGLQQVMIYDRERRLRVQAIGSEPVRAL